MLLHQERLGKVLVLHITFVSIALAVKVIFSVVHMDISPTVVLIHIMLLLYVKVS